MAVAGVLGGPGRAARERPRPVVVELADPGLRVAVRPLGLRAGLVDERHVDRLDLAGGTCRAGSTRRGKEQCECDDDAGRGVRADGQVTPTPHGCTSRTAL